MALQLLAGSADFFKLFIYGVFTYLKWQGCMYFWSATNNKPSTPVISDPSQICSALVGLKDINILYYSRSGPIAQIAIEQVITDVSCKNCGSKAEIKDRDWVSYVDLPFGGTPTRLLFYKHRIKCKNNECKTKSFTLGDHRISATGCRLTTRAAKWATAQVGMGRTVSEVATELRCDWKVVNKAVLIYGEVLLDADKKRLKKRLWAEYCAKCLSRCGLRKLTCERNASRGPRITAVLVLR